MYQITDTYCVCCLLLYRNRTWMNAVPVHACRFNIPTSQETVQYNIIFSSPYDTSHFLLILILFLHLFCPAQYLLMNKGSLMRPYSSSHHVMWWCSSIRLPYQTRNGKFHQTQRASKTPLGTVQYVKSIFLLWNSTGTGQNDCSFEGLDLPVSRSLSDRVRPSNPYSEWCRGERG